ncbi:MAG: cytochrome c biogenesis protein CcdA [Actinobacteria bacterium]|nr:cytochrome c biogenesis protein CcdA [Actinomycetota bacterium]
MVLASLAVVSGALSVTIPCCLPMIPAYLSYVSGASDGSPGPEARSAALRAALVFVAGFAVVFVTLGASLGVVGPVLVRVLPGVERVAGVVIIAIGLRLAGVLRLPSCLPSARCWPPSSRCRAAVTRSSKGPFCSVSTPQGSAFPSSPWRWGSIGRRRRWRGCGATSHAFRPPAVFSWSVWGCCS